MSKPYDVQVVWTISGWLSVGANSRDEAEQAVNDMNDGEGPVPNDADGFDNTMYEIMEIQEG